MYQLSPDAALLLSFAYETDANTIPLYPEAGYACNAFTNPGHALLGPRFNDFNPRDLFFEPCGSLSFRPSDCGDATLAWNSPVTGGGAMFGIGSTSLARSPGGRTSRDADSLDARESNWHQPQLQGAGVHVDITVPMARSTRRIKASISTRA